MSGFKSCSLSPLRLIYLVYRVNWLRAKARVDRWAEEMTLVRHEMQWTILWFQNQQTLWSERYGQEGVDFSVGHKSYAKKQQKLWGAFKRKASERFDLYLSS